MTTIILLVISLVVLVPLIAIAWTLRHEVVRCLPPAERKRRPRAE
jgi:hypothetical protein